MVNLIFALSLLSALVILVLSLSSLVTKRFLFWPPPHQSSWQYHCFWWLFRIVMAGIVTLSFLDFDSFTILKHPARLYLGAVLAVPAFVGAFYITFYLGWKNAHGEEEGLVVKGWYSWSRNPVYVISIVGFSGWALAINSLYVYGLAGLLIITYMLAPFLEEPWLEKRYGEAYLNYKVKVPRFFGISKSKT